MKHESRSYIAGKISTRSRSWARRDTRTPPEGRALKMHAAKHQGVNQTINDSKVVQIQLGNVQPKYPVELNDRDGVTDKHLGLQDNKDHRDNIQASSQQVKPQNSEPAIQSYQNYTGSTTHSPHTCQDLEKEDEEKNNADIDGNDGTGVRLDGFATRRGAGIGMRNWLFIGWAFERKDKEEDRQYSEYQEIGDEETAVNNYE
eukprot:GHVT01099064.1.p1 GENE.GHVT01099064.1~~GHVT01099064.1.p1  ORF type:complete len:202 (+),score=23.01 GHVT01099064.1:182-787(+)